MFIPTTLQEFAALGWKKPDIVLVSGDAYIDSPFDGCAIIGHTLIDNGFKVGIISQPDINGPADITRLGEPSLFWGVSAGCVDSMVANYTPTFKKRRSDDFTPGGINNKRPDRAVMAYTNLIRRYFKHTSPIVLGGIEASLRRIAHYDYWDNSLRRPVL
ncbi:MAG: YgiQ family radical SAM protein, partial [Brevinematales bacterium]